MLPLFHTTRVCCENSRQTQVEGERVLYLRENRSKFLPIVVFVDTDTSGVTECLVCRLKMRLHVVERVRMTVRKCASGQMRENRDAEVLLSPHIDGGGEATTTIHSAVCSSEYNWCSTIISPQFAAVTTVEMRQRRCLRDDSSGYTHPVWSVTRLYLIFHFCCKGIIYSAKVNLKDAFRFRQRRGVSFFAADTTTNNSQARTGYV